MNPSDKPPAVARDHEQLANARQVGYLQGVRDRQREPKGSLGHF